jgi:hypothetical protein
MSTLDPYPMQPILDNLNAAFAGLPEEYRSLRIASNDWHAAHENLVLLVTWAESEGYSAAEIVRMVEKPWKWRAEYIIASCRSTDTRKRA